MNKHGARSETARVTRYPRPTLRRRLGLVALAGVAGTGLAAVTTATPVFAAGLSVTDLNNGSTANGLAQSLVGSGVSIANVTYTGDNRAAGKFSGGTGIIGFESGVVLDSGKVQTYSTDPPCSKGVEGPNSCHEPGSSNTTGFGGSGDADLTTLSGHPTFDASVLQFDFTPQFSTLQVNYVFSSEEYSDFANTQFNDVFAFFVNGTNCALVPNTSDPVSVNTINNGNDNGGDTTPHNPQFFIDNVRPSPSLNTEMDGLTTVLTCTASVNSGQSNHMKLAVADASDPILDSAVFIQAGSLVSGTTISTNLQGGGQSGTAITVPPNTAVTDSATLGGGNSSTATGTVSYNVYSENTCHTLVASGGTKTVTGGTVPASDPVTLAAPGTYYWQASYSGDDGHNSIVSTCGAETESVVAVQATCSAAPDHQVLSFTGTINEYNTPTLDSLPEGIVCGPDGNLWFTEEGQNRIGKLTPAGVFTEYNLNPPRKGTTPESITVGPDGALWFVESGINRIGRITTGGTVTDFKVSGTPQLETITSGPDGNLWFADNNHAIWRMTTTGTLTKFTLASGHGTEGIVTAPDGNLWFTEPGASRIGKITPTGTITEYALASGRGPTWITVGPDGNLWFSETSANKIGKSTTGGAVTEYSIPTASSQPGGITSGPDGALWFTETESGKIGRITTAGVVTNEYPLDNPHADGPIGITQGPCGLWVTNEKSSEINNLQFGCQAG